MHSGSENNVNSNKTHRLQVNGAGPKYTAAVPLGALPCCRGASAPPTGQAPAA